MPRKFKYWISTTLKLDAIKRRRHLEKKGFEVRIRKGKNFGMTSYHIYYRKKIKRR